MPDPLLGLGPYVNLGGWLVVVALVVVSMVRGWLISGTQVQRMIDVYERLLTDKDRQISNWMQAYQNSDSRGDILAKNQESLLRSIETTNSLIQTVVTNPSSKEKV